MKIKDIKFDEVEIFEDKPQSAAYYVTGDFEVYFNGMTFKKHCTKKVAKEICKQFGIEWEWGDDEVISGSYDNDWDDAFYKVEEGLKNKPIHYKDNHNLRGEVFLKELYENYGIEFEDGIFELVDLVAYLISEGGYKIIKK